MKVFVLTEIDLRHVGYSPNTIQLFTSYDDAVSEMKKMYSRALVNFKTTEDKAENAFSEAEGYAYVGDADYRLDIIECELDLRDYIHDIQELTVVAEERGVRTKLMDRSKSRPDVWYLIQEWAEEFREENKDYDRGEDIYFYDEVDAFVDSKNKELDNPYPEIVRVCDSAETEVLSFTFPGFPTEELHTEITAYDGFATNGVIKFTYPKVSELTAEQIDEIDEYTGGRVKDSNCITPWDVLLKFGRIEWYDELMNIHNNHDKALVHRINTAWVQNKDAFKPILCALYERDIDEITDSDAFAIGEWREWPEYTTGMETDDWSAYNDRAFADMQTNWELYAENYLMHIADDGDLETILSFIR